VKTPTWGQSVALMAGRSRLKLAGCRRGRITVVNLEDLIRSAVATASKSDAKTSRMITIPYFSPERNSAELPAHEVNIPSSLKLLIKAGALFSKWRWNQRREWLLSLHWVHRKFCLCVQYKIFYYNWFQITLPWRMASSGILRRVALVKTDISDERSASFIRMTITSELGTTWYFLAACVSC
jgi:hypothetical protein